MSDDKALREAIRREWAYNVPKKDLIDRREQLEAKLAKAVEALADVYRLHLRRGPAWDHEPTKKIMDHARTTLAELKGQNDE